MDEQRSSKGHNEEQQLKRRSISWKTKELLQDRNSCLLNGAVSIPSPTNLLRLLGSLLHYLNVLQLTILTVRIPSQP